MKTFLFLSVIGISLFSCNGKSVTPPATQHDTIQVTETGKQIPLKDSIINEGEYILHYENGVIKIRGMMENGKREGLWKSWYENGQPWSETTFKEGKKDGPTTTWYENEQKRYVGFYTNDQESGHWTFWDEKGKVITEKDYSQK